MHRMVLAPSVLLIVGTDTDDLVRRVREYSARADLTLVEGAGGLLSPLTWEHNVMDCEEQADGSGPFHHGLLAQAVDAPVLLVAQDRLGTISHTLMALKVLELSRLEVVGVVLTAPEQPDASTGSNGAAIARLSSCSRLLCVPRTHDPEVTSGCIQEVTHWLRIA